MVSKSQLEGYEGREQAFVKHRLLAAYLQRFMMILGQHCPRVVYVDCFAGPWESTAKDYSDTSFGQAISIIADCQHALRTKHGRSCQFEALFIEKDDDAFSKLEEFAKAASRPGLTVSAWHSRFQDRIGDIAEFVGSDFAFVLVDPKGYAKLIEPDVLAPLMRKRTVEMLINYMWKFLSLAQGHRENPKHRQNLVALYGEDVVADCISDRDTLLQHYRRRLVEASVPTGPSRTRTVSFPVEYPGSTATKYFLVHSTHNDLGVIKFAEASEAAAGEQSGEQSGVRFLVREQKREERSAISDMFGFDNVESGDEDSPLTAPWLGLLPSVGSQIRVDESVMAKLIEANDCFLTALQRGAMHLIAAGMIENLDMKRKRTVNAVHFRGTGETLRRLS